MISTTEPLLPSTLPKRTTTGRKVRLARESVTSSASRLVAPITLSGAAALSGNQHERVAALPACATIAVPTTLTSAATATSRSAIVTCLQAAA